MPVNVTMKKVPLPSGLVLAALLLGTAAAGWSQAAKDGQAREMEILRRTLAEQKAHPDTIIPTPQAPRWFTNANVYPHYVRIERSFLDGKLTAKAFQRAVDGLRRGELPPEPAPAAPAAPVPAPAANGKNAAGAKPDPAVAGPGTATAVETNAPIMTEAERASRQKQVSDVESKLEEIARQKAARDAAATNSGAAKALAKPVTKRERLDAILKQYIDGKLNEADYHTQRAKIVAEPD